MKDKIKELMDENEKLRMQLAACGVAALSNTANSAEKMRCISSDYKSASWQSVCDAVDREMALREQCEKLFDALKIKRANDMKTLTSIPLSELIKKAGNKRRLSKIAGIQNLGSLSHESVLIDGRMYRPSISTADWAKVYKQLVECEK